MKVKSDPRHKKRIAEVQALFAYSFHTTSSEEIRLIVEKLPEIDALIEKLAPTWPIQAMSKIDLAILRLGVFELLYTQTSPSIIIDEAIEIAKELGSDNSSKFVHGVLDHAAQHRHNSL
jgi:transcription antitermination factor NusB